MPCFCFHWFTAPVNILFQADISTGYLVIWFNHKRTVPCSCHIHVWSRLGIFFPTFKMWKKNMSWVLFTLKIIVSSVSSLYLDDWQSNFSWLLEMPHWIGFDQNRGHAPVMFFSTYRPVFGIKTWKLSNKISFMYIIFVI